MVGRNGNRSRAQATKENPMIKTILATVLAGAFLISTPVKAEEKAPSGDKAEKAKKEKTNKKDDGKKEEKKAGGGW
jgi:hypothetical protein